MGVVRLTCVSLGGSHVYLFLCDPAVDNGGYCVRPQPCWPAWLPMSCQRRATAHSREEMVYGAFGDHYPWGSVTFWLNFYWNVSICTSNVCSHNILPCWTKQTVQWLCSARSKKQLMLCTHGSTKTPKCPKHWQLLVILFKQYIFN